jgi:sugar lactone lactonase YvrE
MPVLQVFVDSGYICVILPVNNDAGGIMEAELVLDARNIVGESPVWDDRRNRLIWVDIVGRRIHSFDPATRRQETWEAGHRVTSIGLRTDGGAIVGLERHIALWDWEGPIRPLLELEPDRPQNRLNEAAVGPDGAFWIGTMHNNIAADDSPMAIPQATGSIYRYAPDGRLSRMTEDRFGITNTFVWPDDGTLVTADTPENALYAYRIESGRLTGRRTLLAGFGRGLPDGSCLDAEGYIWNARVVGGSCLLRLSASGEVDRIVELPCSWPTSCVFGGPDMATLFVTSARFTMANGHLARNPQEGGLFALRPGVGGRPAYRFG